MGIPARPLLLGCEIPDTGCQIRPPTLFNAKTQSRKAANVQRPPGHPKEKPQITQMGADSQPPTHPMRDARCEMRQKGGVKDRDSGRKPWQGQDQGQFQRQS